MANFIFFKIIDFQILTVFNFYDNSDLFNTTLAITLEKLLWMIIETIIDSYVENKKKTGPCSIDCHCPNFSYITSLYSSLFSACLYKW